MTIASRLILSRRSRPARNQDPDPAVLEQDSGPRFPRSRHLRHHDAHSSRGPRLRHPLGRRFSHPEHESARLDRSYSGEFGAGGTSSDVAGASTVRPMGNDCRLPGAVLQARARLVERLRGVSLSETRQTSTTEDDISWSELLASIDLNFINSRNLEAETLTSFTISTPNGEANEKKPPVVVAWEAFQRLHQEVYTEAAAVAEHEGEMRTEELECCICLERFQEGDGLIMLQCKHRFHPACLEPWVRSCGRCPYCRANIGSL